MVAPSVSSYDLNLPPSEERHKMKEIRAVRCASEENNNYSHIGMEGRKKYAIATTSHHAIRW
jgi:hypothetical protein